MTLTDIIPNLYVENNEFDCKSILNRDDSLSWLKTVAGFANSNGGAIYLGVEDKTFKLIGYDQKKLDSEKLYFYNEISNHMAICPSYETAVIPYEINGSVRFIIKITIHKALKKPLVVKYSGMPMIFVRRDGFTNAASEEEIRMMVLASDHPAFDSSLTDVDFDIGDFTKYASFYKARTNRDLPIKELESIGFFVDGKLTNGALFFRDNYNGGKTTVVCSMYRGSTRGDDAIITSNSFDGNLIDAYAFITEFVTVRMNKGFIKLEDRRVDVDAYPGRALFEAIINALTHRDYLLSGTQINVDMFSNRLVISSPGSLFESNESLAPTYDLSSFASRRRNELISKVFVLAKAMEAKGTGFEKIMEDYSPYDKRHQPFIYSKNNTFHIVLPDLTNDDGVNIDDDSVATLEKINNPTRFDISVLSFCYGIERSIKEIVDHLAISNSTFFRKNIIDNLVSQGFLFEQRQGNKKSYLTNREKVYIR